MVKKIITIGIAGDSGVGKSTISNFIKLYFSDQNVKVLCGDDLHKWERGNINWKNYTHLDSEANNLELGDYHLKQLLSGIPIWRSVYSHHSGLFNPPIKINPPKVLINEGLHSFYSEYSSLNTDVKIYIDTDEDLKSHWKIIRDTEERGYKFSEVVDSIKRRRVDYSRCRDVQLNRADIIVRLKNKSNITFIGDPSEVLDIYAEIVLRNKNELSHDLYDYLNELFLLHLDYKKLANPFAYDIEFFQGASGNISVKSNRLSIIKPSGRILKNSLDLSQLSIILNNTLTDDLTNNDNLKILNTPSMEYHFHVYIPHRYVFHCHSVNITALLCLINSKELIKQLYSIYEYNYIEYVMPGKKLFDKIISLKNVEKIIFLENHGIIVSGNKIEEIHQLVDEIEEIARKYFQLNFPKYISFKEFFLDFNFDSSLSNLEYFFPDSFVFRDKNMTNKTIIAFNHYIKFLSNDSYELRSLEKEALDELEFDKSEQIRKNLNK